MTTLPALLHAASRAFGAPLWTAPQAAAFLGVSVDTLKDWRFHRRPDRPAYIKVGRLVRYDPSDLEAYALARRQEVAP